MRAEPSSSVGFGGMGPEVRSRSRGSPVGWSRPAGDGCSSSSAEVRPAAFGSPNTRCSRGRCRSASTTTTRWPACASATARLAVVSDLPSLGAGLVTSRCAAGGPPRRTAGWCAAPGTPRWRPSGCRKASAAPGRPCCPAPPALRPTRSARACASRRPGSSACRPGTRADRPCPRTGSGRWRATSASVRVLLVPMGAVGSSAGSTIVRALAAPCPVLLSSAA